jgi:hypothetical protein
MGWAVRIRSLAGARQFLFSIMSRPDLELTQPPLQCIPGPLSLGVKWPGSEADHPPPTSAKIKNGVANVTLAPLYPLLLTVLNTHTDSQYYPRLQHQPSFKWKTSCTVSLRFILILSSHLYLSLPRSWFPPKFWINFILLPSWLHSFPLVKASIKIS